VQLFPMFAARSNMTKLVVGMLGTVLILLGVALLVLPGPGILLILAGLALLSVEFPWARKLADRLKQGVKGQKSPPEPPQAPDRPAGTHGAPRGATRASPR